MTNVQHRNDVIDLILLQHSEIKALFNRLAMARGEQKRDLFQDLVRLWRYTRPPRRRSCTPRRARRSRTATT